MLGTITCSATVHLGSTQGISSANGTRVASESAIIRVESNTGTESAQISQSPLPTEIVTKSDKQEVIEYIVEVFGEDSADAITMLRKCENPNFSKTHINTNSNGTSDYSPMQINDIHAKRFGNGFKTDWKENVRVAKAIFDEQGFAPWACSRTIGVQSYWE